MTLEQLRDDLLRKLWIEQPGQAPGFIRPEVLDAINKAFQMIWLAPQDYFRRVELEVVMPTTGALPLAATIQEVHHPVRNGSYYLARLGTQADLLHWGRRFHSKGVLAHPEAYFLDRRNTAGADNASVTLRVTPAPATATTLSLWASSECPRYTDLCDEAAQVLPVPHQYAESILLPIARRMITASHYFADKENLGLIERDYQEARALLGYADPDAGTQSQGPAASLAQQQFSPMAASAMEGAAQAAAA